MPALSLVKLNRYFDTVILTPRAHRCPLALLRFLCYNIVVVVVVVCSVVVRHHDVRHLHFAPVEENFIFSLLSSDLIQKISKGFLSGAEIWCIVELGVKRGIKR